MGGKYKHQTPKSSVTGIFIDLSAQFGHSGWTSKLKSKRFNAFECEADRKGINTLKCIGVTNERFGIREECDILINNLPDPYAALRTALIIEFSRCTWTTDDSMEPESIRRAIVAFSTTLIIKYILIRLRVDLGCDLDTDLGRMD